MKVTLNDFQILKGETELEFPNGITVLVGSNASGKSSIFYAIQNALTNPNGVSECINNESNKTSVRIENNNSDITWVKTQTSSEYINNKTQEHFVKASKLDSRDIADLGFYFDNKNKVINIHDEWCVLFPFGESDTDMFRLFEDIFNISCSFQIIDEMKKDEQFIKTAITSSQSCISSLQSKKTVLHDIKDRIKESDISEHINRINNSKELVSALQDDFTAFSRNYLLTQIKLPQVYDTNRLSNVVDDYNTINSDYNHYYKDNQIKNIRLSIQEYNLDRLKDLSYELVSLNKEFNDYKQEKSYINVYLEQIEMLNNKYNTINEEISKVKVCPTCGQVIGG